MLNPSELSKNRRRFLYSVQVMAERMLRRGLSVPSVDERVRALVRNHGEADLVISFAKTALMFRTGEMPPGCVVLG